MKLSWISTHPDATLKKMEDCIKKSTLRELKLNIVSPQPLGEPQLSLEETREWYRHVVVGRKGFILSLEDSCLESFSFTHYNFMSSEHGLNMQICMLLDIVAASVNLKRIMNYHLPEINFSIRLK